MLLGFLRRRVLLAVLPVLAVTALAVGRLVKSTPIFILVELQAPTLTARLTSLGLV